MRTRCIVNAVLDEANLEKICSILSCRCAHLTGSKKQLKCLGLLREVLLFSPSHFPKKMFARLGLSRLSGLAATRTITAVVRSPHPAVPISRSSITRIASNRAFSATTVIFQDGRYYPDQNPPNDTLFVSNVSFDATESEISAPFERLPGFVVTNLGSYHTASYMRSQCMLTPLYLRGGLVWQVQGLRTRQI